MTGQTVTAVVACTLLGLACLVYLIAEGSRVIEAAEAELDQHDDVDHGCGCLVCCDCPACTDAMNLVRDRIRETLRRELLAREDLRDIESIASLPTYEARQR